uniref:CUB domain-containing protein n=1 Tax=Macrostomum lignano TaxID=282301 RepID=A0A1I8GLB0_9PLAT
SSVYCSVNFYYKYNLSTAGSRLPCLFTLLSDTPAYDSFHFSFVNGSFGCQSDLEFATRRYRCLGGYNIDRGSFNPALSQTASIFHIIVTYFDEAGKRRFNCWLIEKTLTQLVSRMLLFDTAQCGLLFAADSRGVGDGPVYLEGIEESTVAAVFHNPELYPAEARMDSVLA